MFQVPGNFAANTAAWYSDVGREWIERLPLMVEVLCEQWGLVIDGSPMHGGLSVAIPVQRGGELCILKVGLKDETTQEEALALAVWNGNGAVRLLAEEPSMGGMLLERLDSRRSLNDVGLEEALSIAGSLLCRLSIPAPLGVPLLRETGVRLAEELPERWERCNCPMSRSLMERAAALSVDLAPAAKTLLVNYDLIYEDVLAGEREPWLVVDPKVIAGDPEYGVAQLLWTRLEEMQERGGLKHHFNVLVSVAELDPELTRLWTLVRCVDYWLWGVSVGLTEDPKRCRVICDFLENSLSVF